MYKDIYSNSVFTITECHLNNAMVTQFGCILIKYFE